MALGGAKGRPSPELSGRAAVIPGPVAGESAPAAGAGGLEEIPLVQIEEPKAAAPDPFEARVAQLKAAPVQAAAPRKEAPKEPPKDQQLFSVSMRDTDVKSVLMSFCRDGDHNLVLDPDVTGTVSMDLKKVTMEQAFDAILTPLGYTSSKEGNTIRVSRPKVETRVFSLNYLTMVRKGKAALRAQTSGSVEERDKATEVSTEQTSDLWTDLQSGLQNMLSKDGRFFINKAASAIVVTDYPLTLRKVAEFLEAVEGTVQRQVLIEASIVEVTLYDEYRMGLNWTQLLGDRGALAQTTFSPVPDAGTFQTGVLQLGFDTGDLSGLLHALSKQGSADIISRPRITTLNNQTAMIKVGTEDVFFEQEQQQSTTAITTTYKARFFTVGVVLDVTPQIGAQDELTMQVHPMITEKIDEAVILAPSVTEGVEPVELRVPILSVRESSSVVKVRSGQTLIMAGLLMDKKKESVAGVPGLKSLPYVGALFRYTTRETERTELVVLLTPTIVAGKKVDDLTKDQLKEILGTDMDRVMRPPGSGSTGVTRSLSD